MNSFWQERQMNTDMKEYEDKYLVHRFTLKRKHPRQLRQQHADDFSGSNRDHGNRGGFRHYLRKERSSSAYQRTFTITDIDDESIKAVFEDGVWPDVTKSQLYKDAPAKISRSNNQRYQKGSPRERSGNCLFLRASSHTPVLRSVVLLQKSLFDVQFQTVWFMVFHIIFDKITASDK